MRIIDKNTDFYDYLQNVYRDDTITFDRRDSYILTREIFCNGLYNYYNSKHMYLLIQVCNTFWTFKVNLVQENDYTSRVANYSLEFIGTWKDYNVKRELIKMDLLQLSLLYRDPFKDKTPVSSYSEKELENKIKILKDMLRMGNYKRVKSFNKHRVLRDDWRVNIAGETYKHIPILIACGVADSIDPLDIFLSFEEYFTTEKRDSERTESVGITDKEKIENHGFDTKVSFRGK